jgi:hypothetical protein
MKNMFILDKATGKVIGPAVCVLKQHQAKCCTRCAEGNKRCIPLPASLVARVLALARIHQTCEAAHQTLEFQFKIDAELKKAKERRQRAMVPAAGRCGAGVLEETHQFWRQVQLSMLYHTFQLRNNIYALKNIAPVPATEILISLDKFNNTLLAGADNDTPLASWRLRTIRRRRRRRVRRERIIIRMIRIISKLDKILVRINLFNCNN